MTTNLAQQLSIFSPKIPNKPGKPLFLGCLYGNSDALMISELAKQHKGLIVVATENMNQALGMESALRFFLGKNTDYPILAFPDWETLPYDIFSPHQDIISQRLETLYRLPQTQQGILIVPVSMLMQRVPPKTFLESNSLLLNPFAE